MPIKNLLPHSSFALITNFGDESIALIQWLFEKKVEKNLNPQNIHLIYVRTGWAAPEWEARVSAGIAWAKSLGFQTHELDPPASFENLMLQQGKFPSRKFQWCANFLKALPILDFLDDLDPQLNFIILLAKRREASRINFNLPEFILEEPKWGDRKVWHPLYLHTQEARDALITQTPLPILNHRSLECDPCVNSDAQDVCRMSPSTLEKTRHLEQKLGSKLLDPDLNKKTDCPRKPAELFDMGCGNTFGCGL